MPFPDAEVGPWRRRSRSDSRAPDGTSRSPSSRRPWAGPTFAASVSQSRCVVASRTLATNLVSTLTPGSSTRRSRSQPTTPPNSALGPSPVVQARSLIHVDKSASAEAKSR